MDLYRVRPWVLGSCSSYWCSSPDRNFSVCYFVSHTWTEDTHDFTTVIAVCLAVFIYDYFLTFTREVELVWKSRWNMIKVLFLAQRYLPTVDIVLTSIMGKLRTSSRGKQNSWSFAPFISAFQSHDSIQACKTTESVILCKRIFVSLFRPHCRIQLPLPLEWVYPKVSQATKSSDTNSFIHSPTRIALLTYRVWAVWGGEKRLKPFFLIFFIVAWTAQFVLAGFVGAEMKGK
jgi:hypothetical protein